MNNSLDRKRQEASDSTSQHDGDDVDANLPLIVTRLDDPRPSHSRTQPHYTQRSPSRHEYQTSEVSREHQRHDRWRQGESSSSSTHNRYTHASNPNPYENRRRGGHYDRTEDKYSSSSTRGWGGRNYASSSRINRSWTSNSRYDSNTSEYNRWEGRERDVARNENPASDRRRESYENEEGSRVRDRGWSTRDQDWDRQPNRKRQEWARDSRSSWAQRAAVHTSTEDRTWKPAASWQAGERHSQQDVGAYNKRKPKKQQVQNRRGWTNNQYSRKPYDWRDGPSNWRDLPSHRDRLVQTFYPFFYISYCCHREQGHGYERPQSKEESRGTKRHQGSTSRSRSKSPMSRTSSVGYSRMSKRPRREDPSLRADRISSRSQSHSRSCSRSRSRSHSRSRSRSRSRSHSRSRSRSHSRSRSRSRTRSLNSSPRAPSIRDASRHTKRSWSPYSVASRQSEDQRGRRRRRSPSSSTSSSRSPDQRRRSLHRLPVSYTLKSRDLPLQAESKTNPIIPELSTKTGSPETLTRDYNGRDGSNGCDTSESHVCIFIH